MPRKKHIEFTELQQYFHLPIQHVAKELGVCATLLKKICRQNGIQRWPHRKVKCLDKWLNALEENCNVQEEGRMKDQMEDLKKQKEMLMDNPNAGVKIASTIKKKALVRRSDEQESEDNSPDIQSPHSPTSPSDHINGFQFPSSMMYPAGSSLYAMQPKRQPPNSQQGAATVADSMPLQAGLSYPSQAVPDDQLLPRHRSFTSPCPTSFLAGSLPPHLHPQALHTSPQTAYLQHHLPRVGIVETTMKSKIGGRSSSPPSDSMQPLRQRSKTMPSQPSPYLMAAPTPSLTASTISSLSLSNDSLMDSEERPRQGRSRSFLSDDHTFDGLLRRNAAPVSPLSRSTGSSNAMFEQPAPIQVDGTETRFMPHQIRRKNHASTQRRTTRSTAERKSWPLHREQAADNAFTTLPGYSSTAGMSQVAVANQLLSLSIMEPARVRSQTWSHTNPPDIKVEDMATQRQQFNLPGIDEMEMEEKLPSPSSVGRSHRSITVQFNPAFAPRPSPVGFQPLSPREDSFRSPTVRSPTCLSPEPFSEKLGEELADAAQALLALKLKRRSTESGGYANYRF